VAEFSLGSAVLGTEADLSGLERDLARGEQHTRGWLDRLGGVFQVAGGMLLANLAQTATRAIGAGLATLTSLMIAGNAQFEQYSTQFSVLLGSTEAAEARIEDLAEFGRTTPFDLPEVVQADLIIQGFGLHSEEAAQRFGFSGEQIRRIAGDMAAGTGASFDQMAVLLGRFSSGATGEAIQRMQELGIATRAQMTEWGIQFTQAGQLVTPVDEAFGILLTHIEDKYGGMMEAQSLTFEGMLSNLRDWFGNTMRIVGQPLFETVKERLSDLLTFLGAPEVQAAIDSLARVLGSVADTLLSWLLPAVEQLLPLLPGLLTGLVTFVETSLPSIMAFGEQVAGFVGPFLDWISQNVALQGVLIALGVVIGAIVLPALWGIITAAAPIIAAVVAVIGIVALLRQAWETDFGGIRTFFTDVWENRLQPYKTCGTG
jgi:phage-related protein